MAFMIIQMGADEAPEKVEAELKELTDQEFRLYSVPVQDWNKELSPWPAKAVFRNEDFGDGAPDTLKKVLQYAEEKKQEGDRVILCGYSLAGLFALWAGYQCDVFDGIAGVSPSVWFDGWNEYVQAHEMKAGHVYLSLGDKEPKARNPRMAKVGENITRMHEHLKGSVDCVLEWNAGGHFNEPEKRIARGLAWLMGQMK